MKIDKKTWFLILGVYLAVMFYQDLLWASSANPFENIKTNATNFVTIVIGIIQVLGILALGLFVGYSWYQGSLDKPRIIGIVLGFLILAAAQPLADYFVTWVKR